MGTFLAQTSGSAAADTSAFTQINEQTQMFIIDDILMWFWCSITSCKKKDEAPAKAPEAKKQEVEVKKKETANDTAPSNASNSSNSTNSSKSAGKDSTTAANAPPAAGAGAGGGKGSGENNDLSPSEDTLQTIKRLKAKQDAKQGTDKIGDKQAKNADEVTKTKKDMAAGPENEFKDQPPSISQKNQTASNAQKNLTANAQIKENGQSLSNHYDQYVKKIQNDLPKVANITSTKPLAKAKEAKSVESQQTKGSRLVDAFEIQK